jgi:hypothetical protein
MIKFISRATVKDGEPFLVRCDCDGLLMAERPGESLTCEWCRATVTPEVVGDTESVSVQDPESGEWKSYHVQGYTGRRSLHTLQGGDKVRNIRNNHRWQIESIEHGFAVVKLLGNNKLTGAPMNMEDRERVLLDDLRYAPD